MTQSCGQCKTDKRRIDLEKELLYSEPLTDKQKLFESINMPEWTQFLTMGDLGSLHWVATNKRLASDYDKRKKFMDEIMAARGFRFMAGGTNRNCYKHLEVPTFVAKVPLDPVGLGDNEAEFKNQKLLWPYCTKMMQVTPGGIVGFSERVDPIVNRLQFNTYALMIYMTTLSIVGKYVLEDIGTTYFKNWGVRKGWGVCLLDYPYVFELDGNKLTCMKQTPYGPCLGEIDYDGGFDKLYCTKCGKTYDANELQLTNLRPSDQLTIKSKGGKKPVSAKLVKGGVVLAGGDMNSDTIVRPLNGQQQTTRQQTVSAEPKRKASLVKGSVILSSSEIDVAQIPAPIKSVETGYEEVKQTHTIVAPEPAPVAKEETPQEAGGVPIAEFMKALVAYGQIKIVDGMVYSGPQADQEVQINPSHPMPEEPKQEEPPAPEPAPEPAPAPKAVEPPPVVEEPKQPAPEVRPLSSYQQQAEKMKKDSAKQRPEGTVFNLRYQAQQQASAPEPEEPEVTTEEEFPPNPWGKKVKVVTGKSSGDNVRPRPMNPYGGKS